jgi:tetratricopeptide (TPR) repeat protein
MPTVVPAEAESIALLDPQGNDATRLFNEKKYAEAEALSLKILDLAPNHRQALRVLFEIRKGQQRNSAAEVLSARLAALPGAASERASANARFAQYLVGQGRHAEALRPAMEALKAGPKDASTQHMLGVVLTETGNFAAGEYHYRRALKLLGREDALALANLAWNLRQQGRLDEAAALYAKVLPPESENRRGMGGFAQVEFGRGNREKAVALLDGALARWPDDRTLRLLRVMADLAMNQPQAALDRLGAPEHLLPVEMLALGQAMVKLDRRQEAVTALATARRIQRERNGLAYEAESLEARARAYKAYFTADRVQPLPRAGAGAFTPVFLLGFPRSGSSLLEQLLAQVPGFAAGNEASPVAGLADEAARLAGGVAAYPEALDSFLAGDAVELPDRLRAVYESKREKLGLLRPGVNFITDRAASNFWHLGLIKLLYPEAPVIHVLRHPYDLMLSNFAQDRRLEGNAQASVPALAKYFALQAGMISHYRGQLTLRYMPVRYEALVQDPQAVLREVLEFIGAGTPVPKKAALRANAAPLPDPQPAHLAAREPVHGRAAFRHRAYLAEMPHLFDDVREELAPWIRALGYEDGEAAP